MNVVNRTWSADPNASVPFWAYTDPDIYREELEKIWYGPHWIYCGLEAEVPEIGSFRTTTLGERPVIMIRSGESEISVVENRCSHRGVKLCQTRFGQKKELTCPYHLWNYNLKGDLIGVPFRRGVRGQGGMPADFDPKKLGLRKLRAEAVNGVVWATFSEQTPSFRDYLGEKFWRNYERVYSGRELRVIGYNRQHIPANWKLMMENIKDPYHAGLLHVFFATFGLYRADQKSALEMDEKGRHACLLSIRGEQELNEVTGALPNFQADLKLADNCIIDAVHEFKGDETVGMSTIFPSVILQQQMNALSTRQIIPTGPDGFDYIWTHFGFADDSEDMRRRRTRQANLFGPAGYVSADDGEVVEMSQQGFAQAPQDDVALMMLDGREVGNANHMATETAIRGMYRYYRGVMGL
ncbi:MAG: aromatic ring-hydroxylating dioxygenase subunit alpha [Bradyrhizobium sp.]